MESRQNHDAAIDRATRAALMLAKAFEALAGAERVAKAQAIAADPGIPAHLKRAQALDPDIGWLDVAAFREDPTRSAPRAVRETADPKPLPGGAAC